MSIDGALIIVPFGSTGFLALSQCDFEKAIFQGRELRLQPEGDNNFSTSNIQAPSQLVTASEMSNLTSIPESWFLEQARQGKVPHVRLGKYVRFNPSAVIESAQFQARSDQ